MSSDTFSAFAVGVCFGFAVVSLGCVALCLKLYTEFIKEKKYREP